MSKVAFVFPDASSRDHWMTKRLQKRAGIADKKFDTFFSWEHDLHDRLQPYEMVVTFGVQPLERLTGETKILKWFGRFRRHTMGFVLLSLIEPRAMLPRKADPDNIDDQLPAKLRYNIRSPWRFIGLQSALLAQAFSGGYTIMGSQPVVYQEDPLPTEFERWADTALAELGETDILAWDIETPYKIKSQDEEGFEEDRLMSDRQVLRISFAYRECEAVSIPWETPYLPAIRRLLAFKGYHAGWNNQVFDVPYLRDIGVKIGGIVLDGMDLWHWIKSDMDKGLEFVSAFFTDIPPWKHLGEAEPAFYSCVDADATYRIVSRLLKDVLSKPGGTNFMEMAVELAPILYAAGRRGNYIDKAAQDGLREKLTAKLLDLFKAAQEAVPDTFKKRFPRKRPENATGEWIDVTVDGQEKRCSGCGKARVNRNHPCIKSGAAEVVEVSVPVLRSVQIRLGSDAGLADWKKWFAKNGFNPNSSEQIKAYIKAHKHPLPKHHKTGEETADTKHLTKLANKHGKKHPIYAIVAEVHRVMKALSTYVVGLTPDSVGKVYTTYTNAPSTWRLSSRAVNMQNQGKRSDNPYAKEARATLIPSPGHVFVQADSSAIEAVMVGYFMESQSYIDLARKGVHAYLVSKWAKLPFEDIAMLKAHPMYDALKRTVHGCFTGDTEVLTPTGWEKLSEYNWAKPIAEWCPKTKWLHWRVPKDRYVRHHTGAMMHLKGTALDVVVTPNHGFPVNTSQGNVARYDACDLPKANSLPTTGLFPAGKSVSIDDIRRIVAVQADGSLYGKNARFHVVKDRKIKALQELGATYLGRGDKPNSHRLQMPFQTDVLDDKKQFVLEKLLEWDAESRLHFLQELPQWDGDTKRLYRTTSEHNARVVQTIAHVTGHRVTLGWHKPHTNSFGKKGCWEVRFSFIKGNQHIALESLKRIVIEDFSGTIYCPVTESGYFLARSSGHVFVSGNTSYGMGPYLLYNNYPELFSSVKMAKDCQDFLFEQLPDLERWQHEVRVRAKAESKLTNPFGLSHDFFDVFTVKLDPYGKPRFDEKGKPLVRLGKDGNRAVAFLPQSSAGLFMRRNLVIIGKSEFGPYMGANVSVHDGYCLDVPEALALKATEFLADVLTRPIKEMGGLRIGCEVEVGHDWLHMEKMMAVTVA